MKIKGTKNKVIMEGNLIFAAPTIRVKTEKLDKLIHLIHEMVLSVSRISMIARELGHKEMINRTTELHQIWRGLQEQIMMVRMVPLSSTFKRFYRVVRDLANSREKSIALHISGEDTELDKTTVQQVADALKLIVRNSVDQSIEAPGERKKSGKPGKGNIWLRAYQEEGNVVIEIEDDGKGMNAENAESMDVVKKNIKSLKGRLEISSTVGKGTKFKIKIPFTIAVINGMRLRLGSHTYIVPTDAIVESFQLSSLDLKRGKGAKDLVKLRGKVYPLVKLYSFLGLEEIKEEDFQKGIVVLVKSTRKKFCIYVDEILNSSQVVAKNLQDNYRSIPGIIGASLNVDGSISLVLDIPGLEKLMDI
ncbi:MAG: chemotaxis protein CheW [Candidatus Aminicenantes bacterium]|nr:MAG: chemotaxis protein CheW [Candidatus Aminicenantes bacterium]